MHYSIPSSSVLHHLLQFAQIHVHRVSDAAKPSHSLSLLCPFTFNLSSALHIKLPNYWSFSFSISPSNDYSGLIYFRTDWVDLLAVQGTLKSFLQHHSSKASILRLSAFVMVQISHPYMTAGKTLYGPLLAK